MLWKYGKKRKTCFPCTRNKKFNAWITYTFSHDWCTYRVLECYKERFHLHKLTINLFIEKCMIISLFKSSNNMFSFRFPFLAVISVSSDAAIVSYFRLLIAVLLFSGFRWQTRLGNQHIFVLSNWPYNIDCSNSSYCVLNHNFYDCIISDII